MFRIARSLDDLARVYAVRAIVFVDEQRVPWTLEFDAFEHAAVQVLGEIDGEPVAAARLRVLADCAKLERLAVRAAWRGLGHGDALLLYLLALARERGAAAFHLHAQVRAEGFYARHGFIARGDVFMDAGIPHRLMTLAA